MHFQDMLIILLFNLILISVLFVVQKKAIAKNIKHLKNEIQELEDLVAAIIEEFEEITNPDDQIESGSEGASGGITGDFGYNSKMNFEPDLTERIGQEHYGNDFGTALLMSEERLSLDLNAMEEDGLINLPGMNEEDAKPSATEYPRDAGHLPGSEFGLFKVTPNQPRKSDERAEPIVNSEFINDPKHRRIFELWKQGLTIEEIARQLSIGRGEIQLILGIYRRG